MNHYHNTARTSYTFDIFLKISSDFAQQSDKQMHLIGPVEEHDDDNWNNNKKMRRISSLHGLNVQELLPFTF